MGELVSLEKEQRLLREVIRENLEKRDSVEISIRRELEELKKLEISLEKMRATEKDCTHECRLVAYL